jgi:glycosyltransferase involved in cell wall biosynthesis
LPAYGWRPVVVTTGADVRGVQDQGLLEGLPHDLILYRTPVADFLQGGSKLWSWVRHLGRLWSRPTQRAATSSAPAVNGQAKKGWVDWTSRWLQVPDLAIGWLPWGLRAARRAARRHRCRAIYSSAPHWTAHLIALLTKRSTGLPWVADFRDPWRANPFRQYPYPSVDRYDAWLERRVVAGADWVVCNTDSVRRDFRTRFPAEPDKFVTVPNGFEPDEFLKLEPRRAVDRDTVVLTHAGCFYSVRRPDPLFQALRLIRDRRACPERLALQLVGSPTYDGKPLQPIAARYGIEDLLILPGEVPHRHALELMRGSDILLLVGFSGAGAEYQVPGKLYEYFGVGHPILALAPGDGAIAEVLNAAGHRAETCPPDDPEAIAAALLRLIARHRNGTAEPGGQNGDGPLAQFTRREQVGRIAKLLGTRP